ncbi:MAG: PKD domain-containing protein [Proteobacteria bacterium]|nr:PKD domain-containing protein [Pseudomonadota bacterium]
MTFKAYYQQIFGILILSLALVSASPVEAKTAPCLIKAHAGEDQAVQSGNKVRLDGSRSRANCTIKTYQWAQAAGPTVQIEDPTQARTEFIAPNVGLNGAVLGFVLTVTDEKGNADAANTLVRIVWVNQPPVPEAGQDRQVMAGDQVTLDGSGSTDPDDGIATYKWEIVSGPRTSLSDPAASQPTFTVPRFASLQDKLIFQLTVTDKNGLSATDTVTITPANMRPVADAGQDQTVKEKSKVVLNGSKSSDKDDGLVAYEWRQTGGPLVPIENPFSPKANFIAPLIEKEGTLLNFQLTVTDKAGYQASDDVAVKVDHSLFTGYCFISSLTEP